MPKPISHKLQARILFVAMVFMIVFATIPGVNAQSAPAPTPPGSSFEQRLAQRKAERGVTIDEKTQKRIINTCVNSQTKVRVLQQKTTPAMTNRSRVYQQMDAKLWVMIGKLKIAGKDTFNLEKQRVSLAEKTNNFNSTAQLYQQSLDDILLVNCKADVVGFKAMLETARIYRGNLRDQSTDIRNYTANEIKPSLSGFASELQAKASGEDR